MEKSEIISRMMLIVDLVKLARNHCSNIENEIGDFDFSKPINISKKELERIYFRLDKNLEGYCGKDAWNLRGTALDVFEVKIERRQGNGDRRGCDDLRCEACGNQRPCGCGEEK